MEELYFIKDEIELEFFNIIKSYVISSKPIVKKCLENLWKVYIKNPNNELIADKFLFGENKYKDTLATARVYKDRCNEALNGFYSESKIKFTVMSYGIKYRLHVTYNSVDSREILKKIYPKFSEDEVRKQKRLSDFYVSPEGVYQRVKINDFVGRSWLESEVDNFLNENKRGVFLLDGQAGIGKTTFLCYLVQQRGYIHAFCKEMMGNLVVIWGSLCAQLIKKFEIEPYFSDDFLPESRLIEKNFLSKIIQISSKKLSKDEKLVIVIDAIDEVKSEIYDNVINLPAILPNGIYFILSQKFKFLHLHFDIPITKHSLQANDSKNEEDIKKYLVQIANEKLISRLLNEYDIDIDSFVRLLMAKSQGIWIYLCYVVHELKKRRLGIDELGKLPVGLIGYYAEYWDQWRNRKEWDSLVAPLLATLTAAQEYLTLDRLQYWSGTGDSIWKIKRILEDDLASFIVADEKQRYSFIHSSLRDFFAGKIDESIVANEIYLIKEMAARTQKAHERIANILTESCGGDWLKLKGDDRDYCLGYLHYHLCCAKRYDSLHNLFTNGNDEYQLWAEAHLRAEGNYIKYIRYLNQVAALDVHLNDNIENIYLRQFHYSLIYNSIYSTLNIYPLELLVELVKNNVSGWDLPKVARHFYLITKMINSITHFHSLLPLVGDEFKAVIVNLLVEEIEARDSLYAIDMLHSIAPYLDVDKRNSIALGILNKIVKEERSSKINYSGAYITPEILEKALQIVGKIQNVYVRTCILVQIALSQHVKIKEKIIFDALLDVLAINRCSSNASLIIGSLAVLAPYLRPASKKTLLELAKKLYHIKYEPYQKALDYIYLASNLRLRNRQVCLILASDTILNITNPFVQVSAFIRFATVSNSKAIKPIIDKIFDCIQSMVCLKNMIKLDVILDDLIVQYINCLSPNMKKKILIILDIIFQMNDSPNKNRSLAMLAKKMCKNELQIFLQKYLDYIHSGNVNDSSKCQMIKFMAGYLPYDLIYFAFEIIKTITEPSKKSEALIAIIEKQPTIPINIALKEARSIEHPYYKAEVLTKIATSMPANKKIEILDEAIRAFEKKLNKKYILNIIEVLKMILKSQKTSLENEASTLRLNKNQSKHFKNKEKMLEITRNLMVIKIYPEPEYTLKFIEIYREVYLEAKKENHYYIINAINNIVKWWP